VSGRATVYLYDGNTVVRETGDVGTASTLSGLGTDEYLSRTVNGVVSYFLPDAIRSTVALTDANGTVTTQYTSIAWRASPANGAPVLQSVQLNGADGQPLRAASGANAATAFAYYANPGGSNPANSGDPDPTFGGSGVGIREDIHVPRFRDADKCNNRDFLDLNGDGRPDLVLTGSWQPDFKYWTVYLNQGRGAGSLYEPSVWWWSPNKCLRQETTTTIATGTTQTDTITAVVDLDGDGFADYVDTSQPLVWQVYRGDGVSGFSMQPQQWTSQSGFPHVRAQRMYGGSEFAVHQDLVDVDGDGRPDVLYTGISNTWHLSLNTGTGFAAPVSFPASQLYIRAGASGHTDWDFFDVNGDGLPDLVVVGGKTGAFFWDVWYGTGSGLAAADAQGNGFRWTGPPSAHLRAWDASSHAYEVDILDVNGDHLPDIVDASNWTAAQPLWRVYLNTGQGIGPAQTWYAPARLRQKSADNVALVIDTFDIDGNGYPDIVVAGALLQTGTFATIWFGHPTPYRPDTLRVITNPLGGTTSITYAASSDFNTPGVDPDVRDSRSHLPFPVTVVRSMLRAAPEEGGDGEVLATYAYDGGYYDASRRELRGFATFSKTDAYGSAEVTTYHQTDALRGKPATKAVYARAGNATPDGVLTLSLWNWTADPFGARFLPHLNSIVRYDFSSGSGRDVPWTNGAAVAVTTSYHYDACGNLDTQTTNDGSSAVTQTADFAGEPHWGCNANALCASSFCNRPDTTTTVDSVSPVQQRMTYDAAANLLTSQQVGLDNPTTVYGYGGDLGGNPTSITDPRGTVTTIAYDLATHVQRQRVVQDANDAALVTTTSWDARFAKPTDVTDPAGALTRYGYDSLGRLNTVIEPGMSINAPTRFFAYLIGSSAGFQYDVFTYEPERADYLTQATFYDSLGRQLQTQATREWNGQEKVIVTDAVHVTAGGRGDLAYAPIVGAGDPRTLVATAGNPATAIGYDEFSRPIARVAPDGSVTTTSRATARVQRQCDPRHNADTTTGMCSEDVVDGIGRAVTHRTYLGSAAYPNWYTQQERTYDGASRVTRVRQNALPATDVVTAYDALGRKRTVADPDSGTWNFAYDPNGNLVYVDDPKTSQHVEMRYDALNRPTDRLTYAADAQGQGAATPVAHYVYDGASVSYGRGRLASVTDLSGETDVLEYDGRGHVKQQRQRITFQGVTGQFTTAMTYDDAGRMRTMTYPYPNAAGRETVYYDYSRQGSLARVLSDHGAYLVGATHDEFGRVVETAYGNGIHDDFIHLGATGLIGTGGLSGRGGFRLFEIRTQQTGVPFGIASAEPVRDIAYADYDQNGNVAVIRDLLTPPSRPTSLTEVVGYDDASRVSSAIQCGGTSPYTSGFGNDALGNLTAKEGQAYTYRAAQPHQVDHVGAADITYDLDGNMTGLPSARGARYDAEGRLVQVTAATTLATYLYDYRGLRVASTTSVGTTLFFDTFDVRGGTIVRHIRAGMRLIASSTVTGGVGLLTDAGPPASTALAWDATGVLVLGFVGCAVVLPGRRRVGALGCVRRGALLLPVPLLLLNQLSLPPQARGDCGGPPPHTVTPPLPGTIFYHPDHLGTAQLLTDEGGHVLEHLVTRPYGAVGGAYGPSGTALVASRSPFLFTGQRADDGTGLLYFGARYYDPALAMFVAQDPAAQFFSPYTYTNGNPLNGSDPTGAEDQGLPDESSAPPISFDPGSTEQPDENECQCTPIPPTDPNAGDQPLAPEAPDNSEQASFSATVTPTSGWYSDPLAGSAGLALYLGYQVAKAGNVRAALSEQVQSLDAFDSEARSALKLQARADTPMIVRDMINYVRPGVGPRPGSFGSANVPNATWNLGGVAAGVGGRALFATGVAYDVARIYRSNNPLRTGMEVGFGTVGAFGGGGLGTLAGSAVFPGPGTLLGGVSGSLAGTVYGERLGGMAYDYFFR
jgi:RHS repeat-associated protein